MSTEEPIAGPVPRKWRPIGARERRVLGVLIEKAKTTPEAYPLTLNAIATGSNQKNNRFPQSEYTPDDIEPALDRLKGLHAVAEIQGSGRVAKFRHLAYDWLGVDKVELAVMAELLLRGAQTEGELRGRAARMEPIADVAALRPILDSLRKKELIISLNSEGRGHVLSHNLYEPRELEKLKAEHAGGGGGVLHASDSELPPRPSATAVPAQTVYARPQVDARPSESTDTLQREVNGLRIEVTGLRGEVEELSDKVKSCLDELQRLKDSLGA